MSLQRYEYDLSKFVLNRTDVRFAYDTLLDNMVPQNGDLASLWGSREYASGIDLSSGAIRATFTDSKGVLYVVAGNKIQSYDGQKWNDRGTINTTSGNLTFVESQNPKDINTYIYFCDGTYLYRIDRFSDIGRAQDISKHLPDVGNMTTQIQAQAAFITYYQHRLILTCGNSDKWFYSEVNPDGIDLSNEATPLFPALNYKFSETQADPPRRVMATDLIYVLGERTVEVWQPTGNFADPFASNTQNNFLIGTNEPYSAVAYLNKVFFVATDSDIYMLDSGSLAKASNPGYNFYLRQLIYNAFPVCINYQRHIVFKRQGAYPLLFNPETFSLVECSNFENAISSFWLDGEFKGFATAGKLYHTDSEAANVENLPMRRLIKTPILFPDNRIIMQSLEVQYACDTPPDNFNADDYQMFVCMSKDGGLNKSERRKYVIKKNQGIAKFYGWGMAHNPQFIIEFSIHAKLLIKRIAIFYKLLKK